MTSTPSSPTLCFWLCFVTAISVTAVPAWSQEVTKGGIDNPTVAVNFCKTLQAAVKEKAKGKIADWVNAYPIQVEYSSTAASGQRQTQTALIADRRDFIERFSIIFDSQMQHALFSESGCELQGNPDGSARIANGRIYIDQVNDGAKTVIELISPPSKYKTIYQNPADLQRSANSFLAELQSAIAKEDARAVAELCEYPFFVNSNGGHATVEDRTHLAAGYPKIFTPAVKKAIVDASSAERVGWRGFMVGDGTVWFDLVYGTDVIRVTTLNMPSSR